jgi:phosphatidyl-myo-inositol dimannoside synthase
VISELRQAQVFALPVRTRLGSLNPEGLGLAALEAAACGLPVIIGDSGGAPETVRDGETGYVVPASDHRALADRICELLADPAQARAMGARGRADVSARFGADQASNTLRRALQLSPPA